MDLQIIGQVEPNEMKCIYSFFALLNYRSVSLGPLALVVASRQRHKIRSVSAASREQSWPTRPAAFGKARNLRRKICVSVSAG